MSQSNDSNQETTTTTSATNIDKTLLEYIQTTILQIKKDRVQCNLKSIFQYLKQHYADYEAVQTLNEKELMRKLDVGVKEGILSRKFGGGSGGKNSGGGDSSRSQTQTLPQPPPPPSLGAGASATAAASTSHQKLSNETFKLPDISVPINDNTIDNTTNLDDYKRLVNGILSILIKAVFYLSNSESGGGGSSSGASSLDAICKYLYESYTFETVVTDNEMQQNDEDNMARLKACVKYLLKKKEKIFIVRCGSDASGDDDGQTMYAFNAAYLQHKIENEENQRPSIVSTTTATTTNTSQPKLTLPPPTIVKKE